MGRVLREVVSSRDGCSSRRSRSRYRLLAIPVALYHVGKGVDYFLGFPVDEIIPVGYYEYADAAWAPSENGRVVEILGTQDGLAQLDFTGDGVASSEATLDARGVTDGARREFAGLYDVGQQLWRTPIPRLAPTSGPASGDSERWIGRSRYVFGVGRRDPHVGEAFL